MKLSKCNLGAGGNQKMAGAIMDELDSRRLALQVGLASISEGVEQLINIWGFPEIGVPLNHPF